ncbi:hypothetical protein FGRMN_4365 [Fusarium graminum]|nr:hypothetical protein FGRMN_4365 [Fusarium graminum]
MWFRIAAEGIKPIFLENFTAILQGATCVEEYGKMVGWQEHPEARQWMLSRKQYLPGWALLILEFQQRLMKFLVDCCHQILHEIPPEIMASEDYPVQPEPILRTGSDASGFNSLAVMATEAPYRRPAGLDLQRIVKFLEARVLAAEDHIWALREDPAYFSEQFREMMDHRQEMLPDKNGKPHPVLQPFRINTFWSRILFNMILEAYSNLEAFTKLHRQAVLLLVLEKYYEKDIDPTKDLPREYLVALCQFKFSLEQAAKGPLDQLEVCQMPSPPMRKFYAREPTPNPHTHQIFVDTRPGLKLTGIDQRMTFLISMLWQDNYGLYYLRLPLIVDELERLMQSDAKADALVSAHVAKIIGDVAIIAQCLKQLELYQPWAAQFEYYIESLLPDLRRQYAPLHKPFKQLRDALMRNQLDEASRLAEPSDGKFTYPYGKSRTKDTVDALRRAEANLDMVWAKVDEVTKASVTEFEKTALYRLFSKSRTLRRTAEWVEPAKTQSKDAVVSKDLWELNRPLSNLFLDSPTEGPDKFIPQQKSKQKVKTKGVLAEPATTETISPPADSAPKIADTQPTFSVDAKSLKVFRTLFFDPEVTSTPGSIAWIDFLYAMASTGFKIEKLYGSVWQFTPTNLDVERGIHSHEPHPKGKIPFETTRRHGRRLARAYGWHRDMFVLKGSS